MIALNPRSDKAYYDRGRAYGAKGDLNKALEDVRSIEKLGGSVYPEFIAKLKNRDSSPDKKEAEKNLKDIPELQVK